MRTAARTRVPVRELHHHARQALRARVHWHHPADSPSRKVQGLTDEQYRKIGDFVVWDSKSNAPKPLTRDMVGNTFARSGLDVPWNPYAR